MSRCNKIPSPHNRGVALIIVLSIITIVSLILIAFVSLMRTERSASQSYVQSANAEQIARGGLNLVVADMQNEMGSYPGATDMTFPSKPLFTNVTSSNLRPRKVGANAAMPNLLRTSTTTNFSGGTTGLTSSTNNTGAPSLNGRYVDTNRWNAPYLGQFPNAAATPSWILMSRQGATNGAGATFTPTVATSVNNAAAGNNNYVIGRFAYAVYDIGGLLDVNVAGFPTGMSTADAQKIKSTAAGADISVVGVNTQNLLTWRNEKTSTFYYDYIHTNAAVTGFKQVAQKDRTFLSRQDLIKAALTSTAGLSTNMLPNLTTFSRERNAPSWQPSPPPAPAISNVPYDNWAQNSTSTNTFVPAARWPKPVGTTTITAYKVDGTPYTYSVASGDPVVNHRFPLDYLKWITKNGPLPGISDAAIKAVFGLQWQANGVWRYVAESGSKTISVLTFKTLDQVAQESPAREPNFFELLQAGILAGSIGLNGDYGNPSTNGFLWKTSYEGSRAFNIMRIGANILSQYEPSCYPVVVEGNIIKDTYWQAAGIEDLPYVNMLTFLAGVETAGSSRMNMYYVAGLWNPHISLTPSPDRPKVRIRIAGNFNACCNYGKGHHDGTPVSPYLKVATNGPLKCWGRSYVINDNDAIQDSKAELLNTTSGFGVHSFANPRVPLPNDFVHPPSTGSSAVQGWAAMPPLNNGDPGTQYVGYRFEDFELDLTDKPAISDYPVSPVNPAQEPGNYWTQLNIFTNPDILLQKTVNVWLEYLNPQGQWIPYTYFSGINDPDTWAQKGQLVYAAYMGQAWELETPPSPPGPPPGDVKVTKDANQNPTNLSVTYTVDAKQIDPPWTGLYNRNKSEGMAPYYRKYFLENQDPRTLRFNPGQIAGPNDGSQAGANSWSDMFKTSNWSSKTNIIWQPFGHWVAQVAPYIFRPGQTGYAHFGVARNNNTAYTPGVNYSSGGPTFAKCTPIYPDPDGVIRMADSGLFTQSPVLETPVWGGDPWALSTSTNGDPSVRVLSAIGARILDRPIMLNRPFVNVGEMGYACRDIPWRTLDFFSANSGDAGLLDLFTTMPTVEPVVAGKIDINSGNGPMLAAVLQSTQQDVDTSSAIITPPVAKAIGTSLAAKTLTTPFLSKSEIATSFTPNTTPLYGNDVDNEKVKARREAVTRGLADVTQTRTWNLLIDVVAQAGRYPPGAKNLDNFVVEGQKHYWMHVALDRFTGEIIDQQLEAVTP